MGGFGKTRPRLGCLTIKNHFFLRISLNVPILFIFFLFFNFFVFFLFFFDVTVLEKTAKK